MDLTNSQLNLGVDLDYNKEEKKVTKLKNRLKVYKLKYAKKFKIIKYSYLYYNWSMFYFFGHLYIETLFVH